MVHNITEGIILTWELEQRKSFSAKKEGEQVTDQTINWFCDLVIARCPDMCYQITYHSSKPDSKLSPTFNGNEKKLTFMEPIL